MEPRLSQNQSQKMVLSPQIRQYLKLLQLPLLELQQAVETEMAENPVLEEKIAPKPEAEEMSVDGTAEDAVPAEKSASEEIKLGDSFENFSEMDTDFQGLDTATDFGIPDRVSHQKQRDYQETLITQPELLWDFLTWQVRFLDLSEAEKKIAVEIIGAIDQDGYLQTPLEEIASSNGASAGEAEKILRSIQELDPPGVGARNLQESLLLQLKRKDPEGSALAVKIVSECLPLLERRDWQAIAKTVQADPEQIRHAEKMIAHLDPRPGRTFSGESSQTVIPDATISFTDEEDDNGDGPLKIDIHEESVPELRINPYYRRLLRNPRTDEKTRAFIREKLQSALNFMRAIQLRKSTLREITEEIVKAQPDFLEKGFSHLRPLRLKDIASNIGIHESTVSRAISGKYISTPQGLIPYRSFFSSKLESTTGESESQKSMLEKVRHLVDGEDKANPLSDQDLVKMLQKEGTVIARRTVAKYRDLLKILPSHLRRKR